MYVVNGDLFIVLLSRGFVSYLEVLQFNDLLQLKRLSALLLTNKHGFVEEERVPDPRPNTQIRSNNSVWHVKNTQTWATHTCPVSTSSPSCRSSALRQSWADRRTLETESERKEEWEPRRPEDGSQRDADYCLRTSPSFLWRAERWWFVWWSHCPASPHSRTAPSPGRNDELNIMDWSCSVNARSENTNTDSHGIQSRPEVLLFCWVSGVFHQLLHTQANHFKLHLLLNKTPYKWNHGH